MSSYPDLVRIDDFLVNTGDVDINKRLPFTAESLDSGGLYVFDDGFRFVIWFGRTISPDISRNLLGEDFVHGWGLDFALRRCVDPAHEKIGVVDSQWIVHQVIPSLGKQGQSENGKAPWQGVRERCRHEWARFEDRLANADKSYFSQLENDDNHS